MVVKLFQLKLCNTGQFLVRLPAFACNLSTIPLLRRGPVGTPSHDKKKRPLHSEPETAKVVANKT